MLVEAKSSTHKWLLTGNEVFPAMLASIEAASTSIMLECYIYSPGSLADRFRAALVAAAMRGVRVRVLLDSLGSFSLPGTYWDDLKAAGGEMRYFNPISLRRMGIRDHRKLLVCDDKKAFVGGFNIAPEYEGDGVTCGWCDLGIELTGSLVRELRLSFDEMFARADFQHKRFARLRKRRWNRSLAAGGDQLLVSGPGWGRNPIKEALRDDLSRASDVRIIVAYFLPSWHVRRQLFRIARNGSVQLILAGKSDVAVAQLAGQSLYRRFLRAGVELHEYQPQVLHAKLYIIDDVVYVGSANLDQRSFNINYELLVRFQSREIADRARDIFEATKKHSLRITPEKWRMQRTFLTRLKQRWSHFLLVRLDPYIADIQWRALPD